MQRITPTIDIYSDAFLNTGIDYHLANEEDKSETINTLAFMFTNSLNIQRSDTEQSIKISLIAKHVKDFIDRFLDKIEDAELQVKLLFNLGSYYSRNSELQLAKEKFGQAKTLFEKYNLTNKILLSNILQTYGTTYIRLGDSNQAIETLHLSLELRKTIFSPNEFEANGYNAIHHTAISYASALLFSEKSIQLKSHAVQILMNAIAHFESAFSTKLNSTYLAYQIAEGYMLMGHYYRLKENYIEAETNLYTSLTIYNKNFINGHIDLVRVYNFMALVHSDQEHYKTATAYFKQAILEADKIPGHNHHLYETYYHLSLLAKKTNPSNEYEYISKCAEVCKAVYGENHPTFLTVESKRINLKAELYSQCELQSDVFASSANLLHFKPAPEDHSKVTNTQAISLHESEKPKAYK